MAGERIRGRTRHSTGSIEDWTLAVRCEREGWYEIRWNGGEPIAVEVIIHEFDDVSERFRFRIGGRERDVVLNRSRDADGGVGVGLDGYHARVEAGLRTRAAMDAGRAGRDAEWLFAPSQSLVAEVLVAAGDDVSPGQPLIRLESMKVLTTLDAPRAGVAAEVLVKAGQSVEGGQRLVRFAVPPTDTRHDTKKGEPT